MKYITLILILCLAGCDSGYQSPIDHKQAEETCKRNDGYKKYNNEADGYIEIFCNDGARFNVKRQWNLLD